MLKTGIYYGSWSWKWWGETIDLENMPKDTGIVYLSFCKPFPEGVMGGLEFGCHKDVVVAAIRKCKARGITVMMSVGGGVYKFVVQAPYADYAQVVDLAKQFECDGIDIDWEPNVDNLDQVPDTAFGPIIHGFRSNGWVGMKLSCAGSPNGAAVSTNLWTGLNRKGLISHGHELDWVNIMAYDSGLEYNPVAAFETYRSVYKGPLYLGIELGTQGWGNALTREPDVLEYHSEIKNDNAGFFVWAFHKDPESSPSIERIIEIAETIVEPKPGLTCPNCKHELTVVLNLAK